MKRRRVERCLLRASVALEAGVWDDVREALDEAARLEPSEPTIQDLKEQLARAEASPAPAVEVALPAASFVSVERSPLADAVAPGLALPDVPLQMAAPVLDAAPKRRAWMPAAAAAIALSAAGGWFWAGARVPSGAPATAAAVPAPVARPDNTPAAPTQSPSADPSVQVSETSVVVPETPESTEPSTAPEPVAPAPLPPTRSAAADIGTVAQPPPVRTLETSRAEAASFRPEPSSPPGLPARRADEPSPAATNRSLPSALAPALVEPPAAAPPTPQIATLLGADTSAIAATAGSLPVAPSPPPPAAERAMVPGGDERLVRAALSRYENAYSQLDAAAAGAVWPTVDRRALSRAFEGLAAQNVSLGRCDVQVSGASAQADCSGSARWTPKVGSGTQTASRRWHFNLQQSGTDWIITQANVR